MSSGSARGLSLPAYVRSPKHLESKLTLEQILETFSYAISLAYASRNAFPFSTYGENLFLTIQNVIITLLIVWYSGPGGAVKSRHSLSFGEPAAGRGNASKVVAGAAISAVTAYVLWSDSLCPPGLRQYTTESRLSISDTQQSRCSKRLPSRFRSSQRHPKS